MNCRTTIVTITFFIMATVAFGTVSLADAQLLANPLILDLTNPEHMALIEKPWDNLDFMPGIDPFGNRVIVFPQGGSSQSPPAGSYPHMRFVTLQTDDIDEFTLSVESMGIGGENLTNELINGGNRSLALVFGYEDPGNYWVVYLTYTNTTRVTRAVNGAGRTICQPNVEAVWRANNKVYQEGKITLTTEGSNKVLRVWLDGEPTPLDMCTFPADQYKPGKVGMGGHTTDGNQAWFFHNITLDVH